MFAMTLSRGPSRFEVEMIKAPSERVVSDKEIHFRNEEICLGVIVADNFIPIGTILRDVSINKSISNPPTLFQKKRAL